MEGISKSIIYPSLRSHPKPVNLVRVYTPMLPSEDDIKDKLYDSLSGLLRKFAADA